MLGGKNKKSCMWGNLHTAHKMKWSGKNENQSVSN